MSLLTSLIKAGTQFQQAASARSKAESAPAAVKPASEEPPAAASDDRFTRSGQMGSDKTGRLSVKTYQQQVGQDLAYVKETLRHKLAEYGLKPTTQVAVNRSAAEGIQLEGRMPEEPRLQIQNDLNKSQAFRDAFSRLSVNEPTLKFVDTALKLNKAYGTSNTVLETLVSDNQQFNGLQDLVHRYDSIRKSFSGPSLPLPEDTSARGYAFSLNQRT